MRLSIMGAAGCLLAVGCAVPSTDVVSPAGDADSLVLRNARRPGSDELVSIRIAAGRVTDVSAVVPPARRALDLEGAYVVPQIIDSHVHLSYLPVADQLRAHGVAGVVDLAAPIGALEHPDSRRVQSGPMLTAVDGYPTQSWGRDGYGIEIASADAGRDAVDALTARGAAVIKVPLPDAGGLEGEALAAVIEQAHDRGVLVVGHAFTDDDVGLAAALGVDVLAHVPLEPLAPTTIAAWAPRPVISTLAAFRPRQAAHNLAQLRAAGSTVLYGTDLGNTRTTGISVTEIRAMELAGMSGEDILASMTTTPARLWNIEIGGVAPDQSACLMAVAGDPLENPASLADPRWVAACD